MSHTTGEGYKIIPAALLSTRKHCSLHHPEMDERLEPKQHSFRWPNWAIRDKGPWLRQRTLWPQWEKIEGEPSGQHSSNQAFREELLNESHPLVKGTWHMTRVSCQITWQQGLYEKAPERQWEAKSSGLMKWRLNYSVRNPYILYGVINDLINNIVTVKQSVFSTTGPGRLVRKDGCRITQFWAKTRVVAYVWI